MTQQTEPARITTPYGFPNPKQVSNSAGVTVCDLEDAIIEQNGKRANGKLSIEQRWDPNHLEWRLSELRWNNPEDWKSELEFGPCSIKSVDGRIDFRGEVRAKGKLPIKGSILGWVVAPETDSSEIKKVLFHLPEYPNMESPRRYDAPYKLYGNTVTGVWTELKLQHDGWSFRLQQVEEYYLHSEQHNVAILGLGELSRIDDSVFKIDDVPDLLDAIDTYLSFSFLGRTPPILPIGYNADGKVVCHFVKGYSLQTNRIPFGWVCKEKGEYLEECFHGFMKLWEDADWKGSLQYITEYLIQARDSEDLRSAVAVSQIPLEMLSSLLKSKELSGNALDEWERIEQAYKKIEYIAEHCGIPLTVPDGLPLLRAIVESEDSSTQAINNGPTAVTNIRNKIIHPSKKKRETFDKIMEEIAQTDADPVYNEIVQLFRWYITLVLLHEMDYQGEYGNRLVTKNIGVYEPVPWAQPTS